MATLHTSQGGYVLGHSDFELKRLVRQAEMIDPMTRRFFLSAGIGPGMRVLDVGSGAGDVAFLLAELVGSSGSVIGFDRSTAALETARRRAADRGIENVAFVEFDPTAAASLPSELSEPFDAVAGRYVLMFQADPVALLRALVPLVRTGGPVVFHEVDWRGFRSVPEVRAFDQCCGWLVKLATATGTDHEMGLKLPETFRAAGLPAPHMAIDAQIGGGPSAEEAIELVADLTISMAASLVDFGLATAEEIGAETLRERIRAEAAEKNALLMGRFEIGAWTRVLG